MVFKEGLIRMAKMKCKKCGTLLKVVVITNENAYVACPKCDPKAFSKGQ
jgi:DNA-directed RNA polymerase subunit RPC12/RpoP